jgi:2-methylaconitate cis-trans-isomerase PrpF
MANPTAGQDIRCVVMRGGTSRGVLVERDALPADDEKRNVVVAQMFGAGSAGQIDGLGGGLPNTSKVAVVGPSADDAADIDYLFGQVSVQTASVDFSGTCGNMASAVGLYAVEEGYTSGRADPGHVRIRDVGTGQILACDILGASADEFANGGLPGTGTAVALDLAGLQGATTGAVLPTGKATQDLPLPDGRVVPATVVDVGNVMAFVPAEALGLTGYETPDEIEGSPAIKDFADLRAATAVALGWCATPEEWLASSSRLPFVAAVAPPQPGNTAGNTAGDTAGDTDVAVRLYAVGRIHRSIAVTAVASTGAAAAIGGTTVAQTAKLDLEPGAERLLRIAHPGGTAVISVVAAGPGSPAAALRYPRTARRLMAGSLYVPEPVPAR